MPIIIRFTVSLLVVLLLASCGGTNPDGTKRKSRVVTTETQNENGEGIVLIGKRKNKEQLSLSKFFGGADAQEDSGGNLSINEHLWRASLSTMSRLPLRNVDPYSGIIETEWYTPGGGDSNQQVRTSVFILGPQLKTENLRVSVFVREQSNNGQWMIRPGNPSTATRVENVILKSARRARVAALQESKAAES
jgi:hypothetical protein